MKRVLALIVVIGLTVSIAMNFGNYSGNKSDLQCNQYVEDSIVNATTNSDDDGGIRG